MANPPIWNDPKIREEAEKKWGKPIPVPQPRPETPESPKQGE